jgi:hypothetical protein
VKKISRDGRVAHFERGYYHRAACPAIMSWDGTSVWYRVSRRRRDDNSKPVLAALTALGERRR